MLRVALQPRLTWRQKQSRPTPYGDTTPMPVIATRGRHVPDIAPIIPTLMAATLRVSRAAWLFAWSGAAMFAASLAFFLYSLPRPLRRAPPPAAGALAPVAIDAALFTLFALHHSLFARAAREAPDRRQTGASDRSDRSGAAGLRLGRERALHCGLPSWRPRPGELYHVTGVARACRRTPSRSPASSLTVRGSARLDVLDLAGVRAVLSPRAGDRTCRCRRTASTASSAIPSTSRWVLMVFGTPHMTMTRLTFAVISTAYLAIAIPFEERGLIDVFGSEYRDTETGPLADDSGRLLITAGLRLRRMLSLAGREQAGLR